MIASSGLSTVGTFIPAFPVRSTDRQRQRELGRHIDGDRERVWKTARQEVAGARKIAIQRGES